MDRNYMPRCLVLLAFVGLYLFFGWVFQQDKAHSQTINSDVIYHISKIERDGAQKGMMDVFGYIRTIINGKESRTTFYFVVPKATAKNINELETYIANYTPTPQPTVEPTMTPIEFIVTPVATTN